MRAVLLGAMAFLCGCCSSGEPGGPRILYLVPAGGDAGDAPSGAIVAFVEVVATPEARYKGLMFREGLAPDTGMLFIYPRDAERGFWMQNTKIPLSIAYAESAGRIVRILGMEPGWGKATHTLPFYPSGEPAQYALEMEQGWFREKGIRAGDRIHLHPEILATRIR